jgi:GAF domain-containing protein
MIESIAVRFASATPEEVAELLVNAAVEEFGALRATMLPPATDAQMKELASAGRPPEAQAHPGASAVFPLSAGGAHIGLLVAEFAHPVEPPRFEMIASLTRQAGEALSRSTERTSFRRDAAMLTALYVVAEAVTHAGTVTEVFERIVATLSDVLGADQVLSMICNEAGGQILPGPAAGLSEEQLMFFKDLPIGPPHLPVSVRVQETFTFEVIPDARDTDLLSAEFVEVFGPRTVLVIPLMRWRQTLGILQLHFATARVVTVEDLALLDAVARQAAVGVENTFLQRDLRERLEDLRRLQAASRTVLGATDLPTVFREIAQSGRELLDCAATVVWLLDRPGRYLYRVTWEGLQAGNEAGRATLPLEGTLEGAALRSRAPTRRGEGREWRATRRAGLPVGQVPFGAGRSCFLVPARTVRRPHVLPRRGVAFSAFGRRPRPVLRRHGRPGHRGR